jgi:hypothetical protein
MQMALAKIQRMMDCVHVSLHFTMCYIDNIIVSSIFQSPCFNLLGVVKNSPKEIHKCVRFPKVEWSSLLHPFEMISKNISFPIAILGTWNTGLQVNEKNWKFVVANVNGLMIKH